MTLPPEDVSALAGRLFAAPAEEVEVRRLPGDASDRSYYRLIGRCAGRTESFVIMQILNLPKRFASDEVTLYHDDSGELPFINIHRHLARAGVPVPRIVMYDERRGLMALEDLGDVLLQDLALKAVATRLRALYVAAVDVLVDMHREATRLIQGSDCMAANQRFDSRMYDWEFEHFLEYGIEARMGGSIEPGVRVRVKTIFHEYSERLSALPVVFTHRDYHSRNIMAQGRDRLRVIDFQDALMAPRVYDLASLLRDSYVALPDSLIYELVDRYADAVSDEPDRAGSSTDMREEFDMAGVQRNLKAAGRFVYILKVKGKDTLMPYVPQTLGYVRRNIVKLKRGEEALDLLAPYVPEWQGAGP